MSTPQSSDSKVITIELSPQDQELIERIKQGYGLKNQTDCLRLALRETVRKLDQQVPALV